VNTGTVNAVLIGAIAMASLVAGLFFLRFWRGTGDRFFLLFAASFLLEAANRLQTGLLASWNEDAPANFVLRLVSYLLIIVAVWDKNRHRP
jgi:hypothetical protein